MTSCVRRSERCPASATTLSAKEHEEEREERQNGPCRDLPGASPVVKQARPDRHGTLVGRWLHAEMSLLAPLVFDKPQCAPAALMALHIERSSGHYPVEHSVSYIIFVSGPARFR